jgi:single-strand DNA-binding protein
LDRSFISEIVAAETIYKRKETMPMLNQLILTGNLGNDPEIFFGSEGDPVTSFSLAFKSGREKTGWLKCVCFNKNAEIAEKYLHSGARIAVVGYLQQSKWKTNEGESRSSFEMIVNSIEFIKTDGRGFEDRNDKQPF